MDDNKAVPSNNVIKNIPIPVATDELAHVTEEMYKKNKELAEKNKALALLRQIDGIILSKVTDIGQVAQEVANTIVRELSFKLAVILLLDKKNNNLARLAISETDLIIQAES